MALGDETTKIFLSTKGEIDDLDAEMKEFLAYIENSTDAFAAQTASPLVKEIHKSVTEVKQNKDVGVEYMALLQKDLILRPRQVFLSRMDDRAVFDAIRQKIHSGAALTDGDLMELVVLPLTVPCSEGKLAMFDKVMELAEQISDEEQRIFIISGMIAACSKFINRK